MLPIHDTAARLNAAVGSSREPVRYRRDFILLWSGGLISWIGNWMLVIALPTAVYHLTGSALATGTMFIAQTLPSVLVGLFAGVWVDRWDRKRVMVVSDALRTVVFLPILLVHTQSAVWVIYASVLAEATVAQFFNPAQVALLPCVVGEEGLLAANARVAWGSQFALLVGPAFGGILYGFYGFPTVLLLDGASFLVSGVLIALVQTDGAPSLPSRHRASEASAPAVHPNSRRELIAGLRLVARTRGVRGLFIVTGLLWCALGLYYALFVIWVTTVLHAGAVAYGWLLTATAVGGFGGSLLLARLGRALPRHLLLAGSGIATGLAFLAVIDIPVFPVDLVLRALGDAPAAIFFIGLQTAMQQAVADAYRGRVFGALGATNGLMMLGGMSIASLGGDHLGVVPLLNLAGGLYIAAGTAAFFLLREA